MDMSATRMWWITLGLAMGPAVSNGFSRFAYGLVLPAMRDDLGWSYTQAGGINTANALGYLIGALLALKLIAPLGAKRLFIWGMVVTVLALFAAGFSRDFWVLSFWRVLAGAGGAPVFIAGGVLASTLFRDDPVKTALAIAVYFGGGGLGMVLSGLSIPLYLEALGGVNWPMTWIGLGLASAVLFVPSWFAARALPEPPAAVSTGRAAPVGPMLGIYVGYVSFAVGYVAYTTFLVAWMQARAAGALDVALIWCLIGVAVMISPFVWKGMLARSNGGLALGATLWATGVGAVLPLLVPGTFGLVASAVIYGASFFMVPGAATAFTHKNLSEAARGPTVALLTTAFAIGQTIGPIAAGWISDQTGTLSYGLAAGAIVLFVGGGLAMLQRPLRGSEP